MSQRIPDVPGTPGTFGPIYVEIPIQGAECPRDISTGQTGHTHTHTRGCPAKILYVYWFFLFSIFLDFSGVPGLGVPNSSWETFFRLFGVLGFYAL